MYILRMKTRILVLLTLVISSLACMGGEVTMRVDMPRGRRSIGVGDEFHLTINVSNINASPDAPKNFPGAKLMYFDRTGQSSRFESYNGQTTQSFTYTWTATLRATSEGSFSFGPISVGGVKSNKVNYTIGPKGSSAVNDQNAPAGASRRTAGSSDSSKPQFIGKGDGQLFLKASVSKASAYEQEALVYTVKLYTTYSAIKFIGATTAPKFEGFVVEESKDRAAEFTYETYNGKTYATAVIARYIIFPQMAGKLKVIGNTYTVSVDQREYYHDPFFGSMSYSTPLQLNITPNDLNVDVRPLPSPQPAGFSGAVGKFSIASSLPTSNFLSNQASSIIYKVTGSGNIKYVKLPELSTLFPPQIEVYSPDVDVKADVTSSTVSGAVSFDYSFMPLESGDFRIPEVTLVYFNPETAQYEKSSARGYDIHVGKGKDSDKSQTRTRLAFDSGLMSVGDDVSVGHTPMVYGFVYWLWYIIPLMLLLGAVVCYRNYIRAHADMAAYRSRKAGKVARKRLKGARVCLERNDSEHFYDVMLESVWGYLGDKLKMQLSDLSRENVRDRLVAHGVSDTVVDDILGLVDECEFAKYSPSKGSEGMRHLYDTAVRCIDQVEGSFDSGMRVDMDSKNNPYGHLDETVDDEQNTL